MLPHSAQIDYFLNFKQRQRVHSIDVIINAAVKAVIIFIILHFEEPFIECKQVGCSHFSSR